MAAEVLGVVSEALRAAGNRGLLVADENCPPELFALLSPGTSVVSNRWDLYRTARERGLDAHFSDFELPTDGTLELGDLGH